MEQDDTWELLDEHGAETADQRSGKRLTRRQKLVRAAGAALAVLVALMLIAGQFGYLSFMDNLWSEIRLAQAPTLAQITLKPHAMGQIQADPRERLSLPVAPDLLGDIVVAPTNPATVYACSTAAPADPSSGARPFGGLLFWSTQDAGVHWLTLPLIGALGDYCILSVAPDDPNTIFAVADRGTTCITSSVYLTHDGGAHWHQAGALPSVPADLKYCGLWVAGTARHLLVQESYERNDLKQDDPQRYGAALYHSEDAGATWHASKFVSDSMGLPTFLADGATLLAADMRLDSPTEGYTTLWVSNDVGEHWDAVFKLKQGFEANRLLVAGGMRAPTPSLTSPVYLLANTIASRLLRLKIAQVTDSRHWATLPPLPIAGATAEHLGITQALAVTPAGKLLVLGLGPQDRVPADGQYDDTLFARQWLWQWDPRAATWSVVTPTLDIPWPECSDGCWSTYIVPTQSGIDVWLHAWDLAGNPSMYRIRLPD